MLVVKVGGSAGVNLDAVCSDAAGLIQQGRRMVIVHGGSDATNRLSEQLGYPPRMITSPSGHVSRRTDRRTLEIFQMACRGEINQQIVERLQRLGVNAVGMSGMDGRVWEGTRKTAIRSVEDGRTIIIRDDFSGNVDRVNTGLIQLLMERGYTPVISPPAISTESEPMNVDADRAAAMTAVELAADALVLLSNVKGLMRAFPDESTLMKRVTRDAAFTAADYAQGRMKKKVLGAHDALTGGVKRVIIGDARLELPVTRALSGEGTVFE